MDSSQVSPGDALTAWITAHSVSWATSVGNDFHIEHTRDKQVDCRATRNGHDKNACGKEKGRAREEQLRKRTDLPAEFGHPP